MLKAENIASHRQYYFTISLLWFLIFILVFRYFQLQILNFDKYSKKANTNRIRKVTLSAPRGLILDRKVPKSIIPEKIPVCYSKYLSSNLNLFLSEKNLESEFKAS